MRRQQLLRAASSQNLCTFCACRLAAEFVSVQTTTLPQLALSRRRNLSTANRRRNSEHTSAQDEWKGGFGVSPSSWTETSPYPSLSPSEQAEKANRLQQRELRVAEERRLRQESQAPTSKGRKGQPKAASLQVNGKEGRRFKFAGNSLHSVEHGSQGGSASKATENGSMQSNLIRKMKVKDNPDPNSFSSHPRDSRAENEQHSRNQASINTPVTVPRMQNEQQENMNSGQRRSQKRPESQTSAPEKVVAPDFKPVASISMGSRTAGPTMGWGVGATGTKPLQHGDKQEKNEISGRHGLPYSDSKGSPNMNAPVSTTHTAELSDPPPSVINVDQQPTSSAGGNFSKIEPISKPIQVTNPTTEVSTGGFPAPENLGPEVAKPSSSTSKQGFGLENMDSYTAVPLESSEFVKDADSNDESHTSNWQHLRRQFDPDISESETQSAPRPSIPYLDEAWVDRSFEEHRRKRAAPTPVPELRLPTENKPRDRFSILGERKASKYCGRCGQMGHVANQCPRLTKMRCHACGQLGHLANECPNRASKSNHNLKSQGYLTDPYAKDIPDQSQRRPRNDTTAFSFRSFKPGAQHRDQNLDQEQPRFKRPQTANQKQSTESFTDSPVKKASHRQWADVQDSGVEEDSKNTGKTSRRNLWVDDQVEEDQYDKSSGKRGPRKNRRREVDEDEDDAGFAREEARDRKQARQAKKEADRKAARLEREARKAEQATSITLPEFVSVQNLSQMLGIRYEEFVERLEELGYDDVFPGKVLNTETSSMIAMEYNFESTFDTGAREEEERDLKARPKVDDKEFLPLRPSVVTIMGHVDHGKTTILDYLRNSSVAAGEAGGITQHIGAFSVPLASSGKTITFLDTPGHAAFLAMRQRGAIVTDIVVLVVAADDSVKPQTLEAIKHAKAAGVPIIVAINKVDKAEADVQRCKQDLARHGVEIEDFGGDTQVVEVSGKTGHGMDNLEETVVTLSEILDHRAETDGDVEGWILEATTKKAGRVATVLVRCGTLRPGNVIVAGKTWARVKTLKNEKGQTLDQVGPGMPVEVDGWKDQPTAGDEVLQASGERKATSVVEYRLEIEERDRAAQDMEAINEARRLEQEKRERDKAAEAAARSSGEGASAAPTPDKDISDTTPTQIEVPFVIKADVSGSVEAVSDYILSVSNSLIAPKILYSGIGPINESDVDMASVAQGHIISFNLKTDPEMNGSAEAKGVKVLENNIIYRVLDDVRALMEDMLPPLISHKVVGEAEVAASFEISLGGRKKMTIAGCKVRNGVVSKGSRVRVIRNGDKVYDGLIESLKNVKKDVQEMRKGSECGIGLEGFQSFEIGDQIQTYNEISEKRKL